MKPPAVARALVRIFSDPTDRAFLLEDLAERFDEVARTEGLRAAKRWYWSQALSVVPWALRPDGDQIRRRSWQGVFGDLRFTLRTLMRRRLYTVGVAGTLGLGFAAATLSFAVAWTVWLAPMSYPDPDRVVRLYEIAPSESRSAVSRVVTEPERRQFSPALLGDFRTHSWRTIEAVSAVNRGVQFEWVRDGETQTVSSFIMSPEGFAILGIVPMLGRLPTEGEREMVLSERFWRTDFGADPDVVGRQVIDEFEIAFSVVGVARLPSGFPGDIDVASVGGWDEVGGDRDLRFIDAIARVRPEHSVAAAKAEVNAFVTALGETYPEHRGWGADAVVLADDLMRPFRGVFALLLAAGLIFLLLACVNVVGLVAARRVEDRQDRSIRLALGASEGRLLRGLLIESLVLAGAGSIIGVVSAYWLIGPIRAMVPQDIPRFADVAVTPSFVLGGLSIGAALGVVIGLFGYLVSRGAKPSVGRVPVWRAVGVGGRRALVVGQVALTTLLTAGGAAILQNVSTLRAIDLGFEAEGVSTTVLNVNSGSQLMNNALGEVLAGLDARGIPSAAGFNTPMGGLRGLPPVGIRADAASEEIFYQFHPVSPDYFSVMGIELLAGRVFGPTDHEASISVVIVSEDFVDQYFPAGTPVERVVGRVIEPVMLIRGRPTVVGVVESTRHQGPNAPVIPDVYAPFSQQTVLPVNTLLVGGEPDQVAEAVSTVLAQVDRNLRSTPLIPYTSYLREWFAPLRLQIVMIGALAALALVLASLGLYSLVAYQVATGRQELGIRKALGAADGRIVRGVVADGMAMALLGAMIGLGAWYQLLPWTREFADGLDSAGSLVPLSVALVVGGSCLLATLVPAVRATQVDLVVTLKAD